MSTFYNKFKGALLSSFFLTFVLCLTVSNSFGQSMANYVFSTSTTGSLEDLTTGSTSIMSVAVHDDDATSVQPIGFDLYFMGVKYTHFSANSNGQFRLHTTSGASAIGGSNITSYSSNTITLAAMAGDNELAGGMRMKVVGVAPNRKLVIEWSQFYAYYANITNAGHMQAWLNEDGRIDYVYGEIYNSYNLSITRSIFLSSSNTATTAGHVTVSATPTFTLASSPVTNTFAAGNGNAIASPLIANLGSAAQGSRRVYSFTPPIPTIAPTALNFTAVTPSGMTLNWTAASPLTGIIGYAVFNSTDGINYSYVNAVLGGATTLAITALTPGTTYFWRVHSLSEGSMSTAFTSGSQATGTAATYYWVGTGSAEFNTGTNWNTAADGSGTARTTAANTDVLVIDGDGTTPGAATTITVNAAASVGMLQISNSTAVTLQSSSTTTRTITITGGTGTDLDIAAGSSLTMNHSANAAALAFSQAGNTGSISGTLTLGGSTSNVVNTTGGTGTMVTVQNGGTVNLTAVSATAVLVGSTATMMFANGSNFNVSGYTTTNAFIPTATWGASSTVTLTGGTTGTGITTGSTSFGNFTVNSATLTATLGAFTTSTITIQGNLNVLSTNTGIFRPVTSGTLNVLGDLNISGGTFQVASGAGTVKVAGTFNQTGGTLDASGTTNSLEFNGTAAQNVIIGTMGTGTLNVRVNNPAGINLSGALQMNSGATLTISNGNISGAGSVVYNATGTRLQYNSTTGMQTANALEFPAANGPVGLVINNTATAPNNVVNIPFSRTLPSPGVLALTAGVLDNTGNVLNIANTATGAVTGGSSTAYVKGPLERTLPASLATGSTYTFPVGKGSYNQVELVNAITNAGGTVTVRAEAFDGNSGGSSGTGIAALNANRYWMASITSGSGNFTSTLLRLYDAPGTADGIGGSATQTGAYDLAGGGSPTVTATSITTVAPDLTSLVGYYVMGLRSSPTLSNLAITPTGNLCANAVRTVTVTATPASAPITSVVINYSVNGLAQTAINMTNTTANNWSGIIPTVSPANATVAWSVTATDANNITKTEAGTSYNDEPLFGSTATATASPTTICAGGSTSLSTSLVKMGNSLPTGTGTTLTSNTDDVTAFGNRWSSFHMQIVYTAAELNSIGLAAGPITAITFNIASIGSSANNTNYTIKIGSTSLTAFSAYLPTTSYTTVFPAATYVHAVGLNTITFSTPYIWDGTSNIVIDADYNGINSLYNAETYYTATPGNTVIASHNGAAGTVSTSRPNIIFTGNSAQSASAYSWSDGSAIVGTTSVLVVNPVVNTAYTATVSALGCAVVSSPVNVTVNPMPSAPMATNSSQCGVGVPTASVADPNAFTTPTFKWYSAAIGGTLLQTSTSATYTTAISSTTNFYVSVTNPTTGCESGRTQVTVNVSTPDPIVANVSAPSIACLGGSVDLSVTQALTNNTYSFTWTGTAGSGLTSAPGGFASPVTVTPTVGGVYTYTITGVESGSGCTAIATVNLTVNDPVAGYSVVASASANPICNGTSTSLNAVVVRPGSTVTLGSGAGTSTSAGTSPFYGGYGGVKTQFLFTAAELSAMGLSAGNITAIGIDISTAGATLSGLGLSMGNTTLSALTGNIETLSTDVYSTPSFVPATGINTFTFTTPFFWNGTSNIILSFCWSNANSSNTASEVRVDATTFVSGNARYVDSKTSAEVCSYLGSATPGGWNGGSTTTSSRPKFVFTGVAPSVGGFTTLSWSDGSTVVGTTTPLSVSPTSSTTYTATITAQGCSVPPSNSVAVTVNPVPSAPSGTNSTQCGAGIPTASVASTAGPAGSGTFLWYSASTGGTLLQGAAFTPLSNYYTNDFSSATLTNASLSGAAAIAGGVVTLHPATTSQTGGMTVNASGVNSNQYQVDLDLAVTATGTTIADGFSYSFGDDALATTSSPSAEHGSGSKLRIGFFTYNAVNASDGKGIYLMYNVSATTGYTASTPGVLAYSTDVSWIPTTATTTNSHITATVNAAGQLTLTVGAVTIFNNVQLPPAFINANKSNWNHVFSSRSGGVAGGFAMDNLAIQTNAPMPGYTTYQTSIPAATTFYVSEVGTGGCESARTPVSVTFTSDPITASANGSVDPSFICLNAPVALTVAQTGSTNTYTYSWTADPVAGSGVAAPLAGGPQNITPTATGTYIYTVTGTDGACIALDTVTVVVRPLPDAPVLTPSTGTSCAGTPIAINALSNANVVLGSGTTENTLTTYPAPYSNYWGGNKHQMLIRASELAAQGFVAGSSITSISFTISSMGATIAATPTLLDFQIAMKHTTANVMTTTYETGLTTVYPPTSFGIVVGQNTNVFTTPFVWNGMDNVIVQTAFSNNNAGPIGGATGVIMKNTDVGFNATGWSGADNTAISVILGYATTTATVGNGLLTTRPNMILGGTLPTGARWVTLSGLFKDAAMTQPVTAQDSIDRVYAAPSVSTGYTAFGYRNGCSSSAVSNTATITPAALNGLAASGTVANNTQGAGSSFNYADASCNIVASIGTTATSLGMVNAGVTVDATVQTHNNQPYLQRHYNITPTTNGPATVKLYALQSEFDAYNLAAGSYPLMPISGNNSDPNIPNIKVTKYTGATPGSGGAYYIVPTSVSWNSAQNWWEITMNVPSFSGFFIHTGIQALDIKLVSIDGQNFGRRNKINWVSSSEEKGAYYVVQRSIDGANFTDIGTVAAIGKASSYSLWDEKPATGLNHYRLKMIDLNATESYSRTIQLVVKDETAFVVEAFPNPVTDVVNVKVYGSMSEDAQVQISDVSGKMVKIISMTAAQATIDMSSFASGMYFVKYSDKDHSQTLKINKQ